MCAECEYQADHRERQRRYYERHRDEILGRQREYEADKRASRKAERRAEVKALQVVIGHSAECIVEPGYSATCPGHAGVWNCEAACCDPEAWPGVDHRTKYGFDLLTVKIRPTDEVLRRARGEEAGPPQPRR